MCNFFSLVSDGKGKIYYFDWELRQKCLKKEINFKRGNRPMEELGLKPLFNHSEPRPIPASFTIKNVLHPDWNLFINKS